MPILTRRSFLFTPAVVAVASLMPVRFWRPETDRMTYLLTYLVPGTGGLFWYSAEDRIADIHGRIAVWPHRGT